MLLAHCRRGELIWGRLPAPGRWVEMEGVSSDSSWWKSALHSSGGGLGGEGLGDDMYSGC